MNTSNVVPGDTILTRNPLWVHIQSWAHLQPNKSCVVDTAGRSLTYQQLVEGVDEAARRLIAQGFKRGDRALFLAPSTIPSIIHLLAILRAGGVIVAADPAMGREAFRSRVTLAAPSWMVLDPLLYAIQSVPGLEFIVRACGVEIPDTGGSAGIKRVRIQEVIKGKQPVLSREVDLSDSEDALIVYTSGTTSFPKGVVHTYRSIIATLDLIRKDLAPTSDDVFYASQSHFLLMAFLTGTTAILPRARTFASATFLSDLVRHKVTKVFLLPAEAEVLITYCRETNQTLPPYLRTVMLGSAPVLKGFLQRLNTILHTDTEVLCIYGATEIIPIARISLKEKLAYNGSGDILGKPFSSVQVRIHDGEIVARGPNLASTYLQGEALAEYVTGDLGAIDEEGRLVLHGRKKDMIIKGNHNVYPTLFESVISSIPGVRQCAMVGMYREEASDEEIILVVEAESPHAEKELRVRLKGQLASGHYSIDSYAQPDHIVYMTLPLSGRSRKVDKKKLREIAPTLI